MDTYRDRIKNVRFYKTKGGMIVLCFNELENTDLCDLAEDFGAWITDNLGHSASIASLPAPRARVGISLIYLVGVNGYRVGNLLTQEDVEYSKELEERVRWGQALIFNPRTYRPAIYQTGQFFFRLEEDPYKPKIRIFGANVIFPETNQSWQLLIPYYNYLKELVEQHN